MRLSCPLSRSGMMHQLMYHRGKEVDMFQLGKLCNRYRAVKTQGNFVVTYAGVRVAAFALEEDAKRFMQLGYVFERPSLASITPSGQVTSDHLEMKGAK